jgi:WD40 repeat protein
MWDPFTLGTLSYLSKHNTSVQDLAINEQKNHLISLGTDKEVIIWDIKTYVDIQRIKNDIIPVRPEDILSGLFYCKKSRDIILGSRRIQFWHFKTQEQIKTSHEGDVGFAIYNSHFESVVSGDDEGYIALWDIENGKLMSRFGEAHGTDP